MKKFSEISLQNLGHLSAICLLTATLAACGGNSGVSDTEGLFGGNTPDLDSDGDGLSDANEAIQESDPLVKDTDDDGLDDLAEWNAYTNPNVADTDGDGTNDNLDTNPTDPSIGGNTAVVAEPPATDTCNDPNSSNDMWTDNCVLKRYGTYARSSYSKGVQRIMWCQSASLQNASSINAFSDGAFGPGTAQAVRDYQAANNLSIDGTVGPDTWNSLREKLQVLAFSATTNGYDSYSISGCDSNTAQFYQEVRGSGTFDASGIERIDQLGWTMASTPGSATRVAFSNGAP